MSLRAKHIPILKDLLTNLSDKSEIDDTLVIVTSDHGEAFGEYSRVDPQVQLVGHSWGIHECLLHIPLVIKLPGQDAGCTIRQAASLTHIPDLIRSVVNREEKPEMALTNKDVVASTYRLLEERAAKNFGSISGVERFVGPWRAVYKNNENSVRKFAQKGDYYLTLDIHSPQKAEVISHDNHDYVGGKFNNSENNGLVTKKSTDIDEGLEDHLKDLGYIRP
ncbi:sulfatase-like hydrolase/transferase [Natrialba sp. SSL1]|uniref:sulfatase-like hydrolase/transferase n=1 Tax=Natrialba sp. SSL1 TaxID=1869245 RepID=UPI001495B0EC|nr:sulfatase-like hydrolase/transferase [Natrialba sp. SSL1]